MKTSILLLTILALSCSYSAQRNYWKVTKGAFRNSDYYNFEFQDALKNQDLYSKSNIATKERKHYYKRTPSVSKQFFDQEGRLTKTKKTYKSHVSYREYSYDSNGNISERKYTNPKGKTKTSNYIYNEKNALISKNTINYNGKYRGEKLTYNANGEILTHNIYEKDETTPTKTLEHTYYENGEKEHTIYKVNGKIKYEWRYDCKPEGELLNIKNKDKSTICIKEEYDKNGNKTVWKREFNQKGNLVKTKTTFKNDSVWKSTEIYTKSDRLFYSSYSKKDGGTISINYTKKGAVSSKHETYLNENRKLTKVEFSQKRWAYTNLYNYKKGLKKSTINIYKRFITVDEYNYTHF